VCPASSLPDTPTSFARMHVLANPRGSSPVCTPDIRDGRTRPRSTQPESRQSARWTPRSLTALERYRNNAVAGFGRLASCAST